MVVLCRPDEGFLDVTFYTESEWMGLLSRGPDRFEAVFCGTRYLGWVRFGFRTKPLVRSSKEDREPSICMPAPEQGRAGPANPGRQNDLTA